MKYSIGLLQDAQPMRTCSAETERIKCTSKYIYQTPSAQFRQALIGVTGEALCVTWRRS